MEDRETFHEPEIKREMIPDCAVILRGLVSWAESMCANITGDSGRLSTRWEIQRDAIAMMVLTTSERHLHHPIGVRDEIVATIHDVRFDSSHQSKNKT